MDYGVLFTQHWHALDIDKDNDAYGAAMLIDVVIAHTTKSKYRQHIDIFLRLRRH